MKIMVDADKYEKLKDTVAKLTMAMFYIASEMGRFDLLVRAGFDLEIDGKLYVDGDEENE